VTVSELIERLGELPPTGEVLFLDSTYGPCEIERADIDAHDEKHENVIVS